MEGKGVSHVWRCEPGSWRLVWRTMTSTACTPCCYKLVPGAIDVAY